MNYSSVYDGVLSDSYIAFLKRVNSPFSLMYYVLFREGDFDQLLSIAMPEPSRYLCSQTFSDDYQVWNLLRKADFLPTSTDLKAVALSKFYDSERACKEVNEWFRGIANDHVAWNFLSKVRGKICDLLGPFKFSEFAENCGFGPGATTTLPRSRASVSDKVLSGFAVTTGAAPYLRYALHHDFHIMRAAGIPVEGPTSLLSSEFDYQPGCKGQFVPKDARSHRFIAVEPTWNMFLQKSIGTLIKRRLKYARTCSDTLRHQHALPRGIDIATAQKSHGEIIHNRGLFDSIATVDLSSASDSISTALVSFLMPDDWYSVMNSIRSKSVSLPDGKTISLEKFSSMGNGFTFELETLIFWAISSSLSELSFVYGDDIIVLKDDVPQLIGWLEKCGFKTNVEKTFTSGPFRETCGYHSFNGDDVTPIYVREYPLRTSMCYFDLVNRVKIHIEGSPSRQALKSFLRPLLSQWNGKHLSLMCKDPLPVGVALPLDHPLISKHGRSDRRGFDGLWLPGLQNIFVRDKLPWDEVGLWFYLRYPSSQDPSSKFTVQTVTKLRGCKPNILYHRYSFL